MLNGAPLVRVLESDASMRATLSELFASVRLRVKTYSSVSGFLGEDEFCRPGCLVSEIRLPEISGLELQRELGRRGCSLPIIFVTGSSDVETCVTAMKQGAFDFLTKPLGLQKLLDITQNAVQVSIRLSARDAELREIIRRWKSLSSRELTIANLIEQGASNKSIAHTIGISEKTVEFHRGNISRKMEAPNIADLLRMLLLRRIEQERTDRKIPHRRL